MRGPLDLLRVGASGMRAHKFGTQVASNNVVNVQTPGYSRRSAELEQVLHGPRPPGNGVRASGQRRMTDDFVEARLLSARSDMGAALGKSEALEAYDRIFADTDAHLGEALSQFEASLQDLSANPGDRSVRGVVLARADQLAQSFNRAANDFSAARSDIDGRIEAAVDEVNAKLTEISDLSVEIRRIEAIDGDALALRDQRDEAVRELSEHIPVRGLDGKNGAFRLLLDGGRPLIDTDHTVNPLVAERDSATGDMQVRHVASGLSHDMTGSLERGRIGGLLQARDDSLTAAQSDLDELAFAVAEAYNNVHQGGVGLDGAGGRNLFTPPGAVADSAQNFSLDAAMVGAPENIGAAADAAALTGDNRVALDLVALSESPIALGGQASAMDALTGLVAKTGTDLQGAKQDSEFLT
ncbi:MAG: flagellar hook-associated protein FlgK, partial [Polyangiales bacterium]